MSLNYDSYVTRIANLMPVSSGNTNFATVLPGAIDYAEQRMYRELDLLYTQVTNSTGQSSNGNRSFTIPSTFIVIDQINVLSPSSTPSSAATRVPLTPASREFVDNLFPASSYTGVPEFFAMDGSQDGTAANLEIILAPAPDGDYYIEVTGMQRPAPLSSGNSSTILTQYVPDMFVAASMIYLSGYMKNFGSQQDDPGQAQSWEAQYQTLSQSAQVEQARLNFYSAGWTSKSPSPLATPPRA